jgi:hypothetical protein
MEGVCETHSNCFPDPHGDVAAREEKTLWTYLNVSAALPTIEVMELKRRWR